MATELHQELRAAVRDICSLKGDVGAKATYCPAARGPELRACRGRRGWMRRAPSTTCLGTFH